MAEQVGIPPTPDFTHGLVFQTNATMIIFASVPYKLAATVDIPSTLLFRGHSFFEKGTFELSQVAIK